MARSTTPFIIRDYFKEPTAELHEVFFMLKGWRKTPLGGRRLGRNVLRSLKARGATTIAVKVGDRIADFSIDECLNHFSDRSEVA